MPQWVAVTEAGLIFTNFLYEFDQFDSFNRHITAYPLSSLRYKIHAGKGIRPGVYNDWEVRPIFLNLWDHNQGRILITRELRNALHG